MTTQRKTLTDANVRALKPAAPGKRYDVYDTLIPNLLVRTTSKGHKTFALRAKFPGKADRVRREIGEAGRLTVEDARTTARDWLSALARGLDPQREQQRRQGQAVTLAEMAEQWLATCVRNKERKAAHVERELRTYVLPEWGDRPVGSITRRDVKELVAHIRDKGIKGEGAPYVAHTVLGHLKRLFEWAADEERFGIEASPAAGIRPTRLIGAKKPRQRSLSDDELRALWRAASKMRYPYGPIFQLALLTGCRNAEVREARWREFDLDAGVWRVPEERFKSGSEHLVTLSGDAVTLLRALPRFKQGDFLFSASFGRTPVHGLSKVKPKLDRLMLHTLRSLSRMRGENPADTTLRPFVTHDVRRTVRTRLASLRVPDEIAEMCLGHGRRGLQRVYDLHSYEPEMRDALERWAVRLRAIVAPPSPDNVVPLREATR